MVDANGPAMSPVGSPENSPGPTGSTDETPDSSTAPSVTGELLNYTPQLIDSKLDVLKYKISITTLLYV